MNNQFTRFSDAIFPHHQKPPPDDFGQAFRSRHVPSQDRFAVDLVHVLAPGARRAGVREVDFFAGNFDFRIDADHRTTIRQFRRSAMKNAAVFSHRNCWDLLRNRSDAPSIKPCLCNFSSARREIRKRHWRGLDLYQNSRSMNRNTVTEERIPAGRVSAVRVPVGLTFCRSKICESRVSQPILLYQFVSINSLVSITLRDHSTR